MIPDLVQNITSSLDSLTGVRGTTGYVVIAVVVVLGHHWMNMALPTTPEHVEKKEEEKPEAPRNFTAKQLARFDGKKDEKSGEDNPVYLSVQGIVFDVSKGRNFYGPEGPYEAFAGHECGVALAKMSFDPKHLDDLAGCDDLLFGEKTELEGWIDKFRLYKQYPVKGRLVPDDKLTPLAERTLTSDDLAKHAGASDQAVPDGYATGSIYVGAGDKVFDVSFGGIDFYGPSGGYNRFAGKDVSRALAKMSFDAADIENTSIDDLEDKQKKVLDDWINTFEGKKGYPIVGRLKK